MRSYQATAVIPIIYQVDCHVISIDRATHNNFGSRLTLCNCEGEQLEADVELFNDRTVRATESVIKSCGSVSVDICTLIMEFSMSEVNNALWKDGQRLQRAYNKKNSGNEIMVKVDVLPVGGDDELDYYTVCDSYDEDGNLEREMKNIYERGVTYELRSWRIVNSTQLDSWYEDERKMYGEKT